MLNRANSVFDNFHGCSTFTYSCYFSWKSYLISSNVCTGKKSMFEETKFVIVKELALLLLG